MRLTILELSRGRGGFAPAVVAAALALGGPAPGNADFLVRKQVEADAYRPPASGASSVEPVDRPADGAVVEVWTDGERVRRDEEDVSFIARPAEGVLWIVYHRDRKVSRLSWPPRYSKHRSSFAESLGEAASELLPFRVEGEVSSRLVDLDPFRVRREEARISNGLGRTYRVVVDRATAVEGREAEALAAVHRLELAISKLSSEGHSPMAALADEPGVVVRWLLALQQPETEVRYAERVVGIDEREGAPDPGHERGYEPPPGYDEVDFSPGSLAGR